MKQCLVTASANIGRGLWTSICVAFTHIFGVESKNLEKKHQRVLSAAEKRLHEKVFELGPGYVIEDFRVNWETPLSVTVSALAVKSDAMVCPKCGAEIDEEMKFCGVCGAKLK